MSWPRFSACVVRVGPEGTSSQEVLVEIVESPAVPPEHQPPAYFIGTKTTVVLDRMTEITWIGDSDFHVGGYVDVYPAENQRCSRTVELSPHRSSFRTQRARFSGRRPINGARLRQCSRMTPEERRADKHRPLVEFVSG